METQLIVMVKKLAVRHGFKPCIGYLNALFVVSDALYFLLQALFLCPLPEKRLLILRFLHQAVMK